MGLMMLGLAFGAPILGFAAAAAGGVAGFTGAVVLRVIRTLVKKALHQRVA